MIRSASSPVCFVVAVIVAVCLLTPLSSGAQQTPSATSAPALAAAESGSGQQEPLSTVAKGPQDPEDGQPDKGDKLQTVLQNLKKSVAEVEATQQWDPGLVKFLTVAFLLFGTAVLFMMTYLVMKDKNSGYILRLFTVPLVIVASVFLVVTGFSNQQITPVVGLLGTIVGYILGAHSTQGGGGAGARGAEPIADEDKTKRS